MRKSEKVSLTYTSKLHMITYIIIDNKAKMYVDNYETKFFIRNFKCSRYILKYCVLLYKCIFLFK